MRRFLLLSVCLVACSSLAARAETLLGTYTDTSGDAVSVNYSRAASTISGVDDIDLTVGTITGSGATKIDGVSGGGSYGGSGVPSSRRTEA